MERSSKLVEPGVALLGISGEPSSLGSWLPHIFEGPEDVAPDARFLTHPKISPLCSLLTYIHLPSVFPFYTLDIVLGLSLD